MFSIELVAVGRLSQDFLLDGMREYQKRIKPFYNLVITELPEQRLHGVHAGDEKRVVETEGKRILSVLERKKEPVAALAVEGRQMKSEQLALWLDEAKQNCRGCVFVIGGSLGLSDAVKKRADMLLSLSAMTFPHQLARLILLEQLYRAANIQSGGSYHK